MQAVLLPPLDITATGSGPDIDIRGAQGLAEIGFSAINKAGTTPTLAVLLQHSLPVNGVIGPSFAQVGTAAGLTINSAATTDQKRAVVFTTGATVQSIKNASLSFFFTGLPVGTVTADVFATSAGAPTGSTLGTSTAVNLTGLAATAISAATAAPLTFTWATPLDLTAATAYAIVLSVSYGTSNTNCISVLSNTVGSGGNAATFNNSVWATTGTSNISFNTGVYVFSTYQDLQQAVPGGVFALTNKSLGSFVAGTVVTPVAANPNFVVTPFNSDNTFGIIRANYTIGGSASPEYLISGNFSAPFLTNSTPSSSV